MQSAGVISPPIRQHSQHPRAAHSRNESMDARAAVLRFLEHTATHRPSPHGCSSRRPACTGLRGPRAHVGPRRSSTRTDLRRPQSHCRSFDTTTGLVFAEGERTAAWIHPVRFAGPVRTACRRCQAAKDPLARPATQVRDGCVEDAGIAAKIVSERLGHTGAAITLDTYSHVHPALQEEAAHTVASLILGRGRLGSA